jgi:hypothetical protein
LNEISTKITYKEKRDLKPMTMMMMMMMMMERIYPNQI